ncbi:unknown [[Mannheimia] succiniciproducens MBEL55E]|uniref:Uncharacterized protein n=1 Tax=Mannheimia succiniciproducens (strain KCTC 0769BP / MBEL55E) TaxID=221988 RepID=Q65T72_MANSM|nr:unknown [[Mannheimia] succiniciproducens MBEL55E]
MKSPEPCFLLDYLRLRKKLAVNDGEKKSVSFVGKETPEMLE